MPRVRELHNLWSPDGIVHREAYLIAGVVLLAFKWTLDTTIAWAVFGRPWLPWHYLMPYEYHGLFTFDPNDRLFYGTLLVCSLPFAWVGVMLTIRRLRAAALPLWLVVLFFLPLINIFLFAALLVLPTRLREEDEDNDDPATAPASPTLGAWVHKTQLGAAVVSIGVTSIGGVAVTALGAEVMEFYGWGVFIGVPFSLGLISVLLYTFHQPRSYGPCMVVSLTTIAAVAALMLVFALEGALCLIMASPIWGAFTWLGATVGFFIQSARLPAANSAPLLLVLGLLLPASVCVESWQTPAAPLRAVTTSVVIHADAQAVWRRVVEFPPLPQPTDALFRLGVAYPMHATIEGSGVGAVRYCTFSTGPFVEPIEVWDEPRLLRFSVTASPATMSEWTFRDGVAPPHLHGFLASERGQFLLIEEGPGRTRLEGTTWYRNRMWPQPYWGAWSDFIIHRIHRRVLAHIGEVVQADAAHRRMADTRQAPEAL